MSDEQPGSEQQGQPTPQEPSAGDRWGDPITPERADTLKTLADQQRAWAAAPDHQGRASYFQRVQLTSADVFWLAAHAPLPRPIPGASTVSSSLQHSDGHPERPGA